MEDSSLTMHKIPLEAQIDGLHSEREVLLKRLQRQEAAIEALNLRIMIYDDPDKVTITRPIEVWQELIAALNDGYFKRP